MWQKGNKEMHKCKKAPRANFYVWRSYKGNIGRLEGTFCSYILNVINGLKVNVSLVFFNSCFIYARKLKVTQIKLVLVNVPYGRCFHLSVKSKPRGTRYIFFFIVASTIWLTSMIFIIKYHLYDRRNSFGAVIQKLVTPTGEP